jgi:hypothetical protein
MSNKDDTGAGFSPVSVKVNVSTEIPPDSSARTLDALTDIIRPITEGLGLLGDKIQLQRQKTLLEIAKRTKKRIAFINKPIHPIPPKFFLPLLEKASLEDVTNNTLVDMWVNLIATASTEDVEMLGQYVNILSNIVPKQVAILESMFAFDEEDETYDAAHLIDNYYYLNQTGLPGTIDRYSEITNAAKFAEALLEQLKIKGVAIDTISVFLIDGSDDISVACPDGIYSDSKYLDFENLLRLGLIDKTEIKQYKIGIFDIDVHYYVVTPVGIDLYACCNPKRLRRSN